MSKKDPRLARAGVSGFNKPKRTPNHPKKSHIVVAKEGDKIKTIRFGQKGAKTAGKPKAGESARMKAKRKSFKARHAKNIAKGKMSAAYWADRVKWIIPLVFFTGCSTFVQYEHISSPTTGKPFNSNPEVSTDIIWVGKRIKNNGYTIDIAIGEELSNDLEGEEPFAKFVIEKEF